MPNICKRLLKDYCENCTFAGLRFIADDTKHWIERFFWAVLVVLSWYGAAVLIIMSWEAFLFHPISFGVETTYIDWNTELPALAVCETKNNDNIFEFADKYWPPDHSYDLEDALKEVVFFRGTCNALIDHCYTPKTLDPSCPVSNYSYYTRVVRKKCSELLQECFYNDIPFSCCDHFHTIETDIGTCFILNSIQVKVQNQYAMVTNKTHRRAEVKLQTVGHAMIYNIGPEEVPCLTTLRASTLSVQPGFNYSRHMTVKKTENDPLTERTTIEQRGCRFYTENVKGNYYPFYSYSGCIVQCRKEAQMQLCQCNDHLMPGVAEDRHCNITGLACLHSKKSYLTDLKPPWRQGPGLVCDCMPSCNDIEISIIRDIHEKSNIGKKKISFVEIALPHLPTERFKRSVVRSQLDLVVSVGGTAGLFVGASVLSFVELLFYFTIRLGYDLFTNRPRRRNNRTVRFKSKAVNTDEPLDVNKINGAQQFSYVNSNVFPSKFSYNYNYNASYVHLERRKQSNLLLFHNHKI